MFGRRPDRSDPCARVPPGPWSFARPVGLSDLKKPGRLIQEDFNNKERERERERKNETHIKGNKQLSGWREGRKERRKEGRKKEAKGGEHNSV